MPAPHFLILSGAAVKSIQKELKPALPKRRQKESFVVVVTALDKSAKVAITGAAVELPAISSGPFAAELPYPMFECVLAYSCDDRALVRFEFGPGFFSLEGLVTKSASIMFSSSVASVSTSVPPSAPRPLGQASASETTSIISEPLNATIGLPLMAAYIHLRKYGFHPHAANERFYSQQVEVDNLLKRAARMLEPLGLGRGDLECLLDKKAGIA